MFDAYPSPCACDPIQVVKLLQQLGNKIPWMLWILEQNNKRFTYTNFSVKSENVKLSEMILLSMSFCTWSSVDKAPA